jgi:hypothetical protein
VPTFFIATDGNDGNDGLTPAKALRTTARCKALNAAAPGCSFQFGPGTWDVGEDLHFNGVRPPANVLGTIRGERYTIPGDTRPVGASLTFLRSTAREVIRYDGTGLAEADCVFERVAGLNLDGGFDCNLRLHFMRGGEVCDVAGVRGGMWGMETGWCHKIHTHHVEFAATGKEHGIYHSNTFGDLLTEWFVTRDTGKTGIQHNGDKFTPPGDGIGRNSIVRHFLIVGPNQRQGGPAMNFDGCLDSVIEDGVICGLDGGPTTGGAGGVNNYQINGGVLSTATIRRVRMHTKQTCFNFNDGAGGTVTDCDLLADNGSYFDTNGGPKNYTESGNRTGADPITPALKAFVLALPATPPAPLPPPPPQPAPPPPPVVLPDVDVSKAIDVTPVADKSKYDTSGNAFGFACKEFDSATHFGTGYKFVSVQPPPNSYFGDGSTPTPKGKFTIPCGMHFDGVWEPDFTGPVEVYGRFEGAGTVQFAGHTVASGSDTKVAEGSLVVTVKEGELYAWSGGVNSILSGYIPSLNLQVRRPGEAVRKGLDVLHCFPLIVAEPVPVVPPPPPNVPPVVPPGPTPDPNAAFPLAPLATITADQLAALRALGVLPKG